VQLGIASRPLALVAALAALASATASAEAAALAPPAAGRALPAALRPAAAPAPRDLPAPVTRPVAPGLTLTSAVQTLDGARIQLDTLSVSLTGGTVRADYLSGGPVASRTTITALASRHDAGPGRRTVAAFNADFFDIRQTGAPLGPGIRRGRLTHSPVAGNHRAVGFGPGDTGRLLGIHLDGTVTLPSGTHPLDALDAADIPAGGIGAYTSAWGSADRAYTVNNATPVTEAAVRDGRVTSVTRGPGKGAVPAGTTVLVGREAGARRLAALRPGDPVTLDHRARTDDGGPLPETAAGGRELLVVDGVAQNHDGRPNNTAAPRTAVGFSRDGRTMRLITVDGRQPASAGVTLTRLALMMKEAGAHNALNLDGGGSTTLAARLPGSDRPRIENSPSDGTERPVPNGIALTAPDGSGQLRGYWVSTLTPAFFGASTGTPVPGWDPHRVFPGLTRALSAAGHDETYGPAAGAPAWRSADPATGQVGRDGVFRALAPGTARVRAERGGAHGELRLTVLGRLSRIVPTASAITLPRNGATAAFGLTGFDAQGRGAPLDTPGVTFSYDRSLFTVTAGGSASFTVRARKDTGSGRVTVRAAGFTTTLTVGIGPAGRVTHRPGTVQRQSPAVRRRRDPVRGPRNASRVPAAPAREHNRRGGGTPGTQ
jgi:hypothetical protein